MGERQRQSLAAGVLLACAVVALGGCDDVDGALGGGSPLRVRATIGGLGDTPGRFAYPRCIEADGRKLWVIDKTARVQRIDPETGACEVMFRMPEESSGKPVGITIAPGIDASGGVVERMMYIADTHYHRVMVFALPPEDARGEVEVRPVRVIGGYGSGPGEFYFPTDVVVLTSADGSKIERYYVSEYGGNDRVSVFDADWKFLFAFGTLGVGRDPTAAEFSRPQAMGVWTRSDGSRELVIVDLGNHRLGRFTLDGRLIAWIGKPVPAGAPGGERLGSGPGEFNFPQGVKVLEDGTAVVTEFGGCRVQLVDLESGRGLAIWGRLGRGEGELAHPWDSAVIGRMVYVLDSGNNRVLGFAR
jgi:DNA-binding beta-propeller fold protein YncE